MAKGQRDAVRERQAVAAFDNTLDLAETPATLNVFASVLDEIALYDKALPADRILEHYRAGR